MRVCVAADRVAGRHERREITPTDGAARIVEIPGGRKERCGEFQPVEHRGGILELVAVPTVERQEHGRRGAGHRTTQPARELGQGNDRVALLGERVHVGGEARPAPDGVVAEDAHVGAGKGYGKLAERAPRPHAGMVSADAAFKGKFCACAFSDSGHSTIKRHAMSGRGVTRSRSPASGLVGSDAFANERLLISTARTGSARVTYGNASSSSKRRSPARTRRGRIVLTLETAWMDGTRHLVPSRWSCLRSRRAHPAATDNLAAHADWRSPLMSVFSRRELLVMGMPIACSNSRSRSRSKGNAYHETSNSRTGVRSGRRDRLCRESGRRGGAGARPRIGGPGPRIAAS